MNFNNLLSKKQKLYNLIDRKILLINQLSVNENNLSSLISSEINDLDFNLSIKSLKDLYEVPRALTVLGNLDARSSLRKSCFNILDELNRLDDLIKKSLLDLMIEKINCTVDAQNS